MDEGREASASEVIRIYNYDEVATVPSEHKGNNETSPQSTEQLIHHGGPQETEVVVSEATRSSPLLICVLYLSAALFGLTMYRFSC